MNNKKQLSVCVLGLQGYPGSFSAKINRYLSINKILALSGSRVLVVNKEFSREVTLEQFDNGGQIEAITTLRRPVKSYTLASYLRKMTSLLDLFAILRHNGLRRIDFIIVYTYSVNSFFWFYLYSKIFRSKLILDYVERRSEMEIRKKFFSFRLNDYLFERYAFRFLDGAFVISDYLRKELLKFMDEKRIYTLPPLCDFKKFNSQATEAESKYLLYCGTTDYRKVADFIVDAYNKSGINDQFKLVIVLSGDPEVVFFYRKKLKPNPNIEFYTTIPREELIQKYKGATALLIPMRPVAQDMARFPQKVSEYVASGRVIVSNAIGEIGRYFKHNENALLAPDYDVDDYASLLKEMADGVYDLDRIATNAYKMGRQLFDETSHVEPLSRFLLSLKN